MICPPPTSTLFPYTTLFRSLRVARPSPEGEHVHQHHLPAQIGQAPLLPRERRQLKGRSEEHTSELQSLRHLVCRLLLEKKKNTSQYHEQLHVNVHEEFQYPR